MADRRSFRSISFALARSVPSAAVLLAVCWLATVMPVAAQIQTGEFAAGESWFFNGASLGVLPPASTPDGTIEVDTNGDGQTDTTFDTPGELEPAPGLAFEYRLSPSERTL